MAGPTARPQGEETLMSGISQKLETAFVPTYLRLEGNDKKVFKDEILIAGDLYGCWVLLKGCSTNTFVSLKLIYSLSDPFPPDLQITCPQEQ